MGRVEEKGKEEEDERWQRNGHHGGGDRSAMELDWIVFYQNIVTRK